MPAQSTLNLKLTSSLKKVKSISKATKPKINSTSANILVYSENQAKEVKKILNTDLGTYQSKNFPTTGGSSHYLETKKGPLNLICLPKEDLSYSDHEGLLDESNYTIARNLVGEAVLKNEPHFDKVALTCFKLEYDETLGSLLGLELASYNFKDLKKGIDFSVSYVGDQSKESLKDALDNAISIGSGVNLARFLVDTPPAQKRPKTYAYALLDLFSNKKSMKVTIWNEARLKKEKMGCMLGVGQGSVEGPHLVHIRYRPTKKTDKEPIAFVGKGITFDTGGLNLKPGRSMRLMKKDMGGSAALAGLALWVAQVKLDVPCDFYFALAENSVDAHSFRPSDVLTARNGKTVEIDNTDAEGRLVMADALSLAAEASGADKPQFLIDVATLTGAIKVGLGSDIGGLFSDNDDLAFIMQNCAQMAGDPLWRMPLMKSQREKLASDFADMSNSAGGFGGAIQAAMFLKEFTGDIPWAHLDIYGWNEAPSKFYRSSGGSGQAVQCLDQFLSQI